MIRHLFLSALMFIILGTAPTKAADFLSGPYSCPDASYSDLLDQSRDHIASEIESKYHESVDVANSDEWIYRKRPTFTWATEAKAACGKAIGYLKAGYINEENVGKCDCFHKRMKSFMNY